MTEIIWTEEYKRRRLAPLSDKALAEFRKLAHKYDDGEVDYDAMTDDHLREILEPCRGAIVIDGDHPFDSLHKDKRYNA